MPVFNAEKYLSASIESILNQTYNKFELILIYDTSQDRTLKIINKFRSKDDRIKIIYGSGGGLVDALNIGLKNSQGQYVARMDSDDISANNRFEAQLEQIKKDRAAICGGHFITINEYGMSVKTRIVPLKKEMIFLTMCQGPPFAHGSVLIDKKFLIDNKLQYSQDKKNIAEDHLLWTQMFNLGAVFTNVNDWVYFYREHNQSLSQKIKNKLQKDSLVATKQFIAAHKQRILKTLSSINYDESTYIDQENIAFIQTILILKYFEYGLLRNYSKIKIRPAILGILRAVKILFITNIK